MSRMGLSSNNYSRFGLNSEPQWNPCCPLNLTSGAKFIAIVQMAMSFMTVIVVVISVIISLNSNQTTEENPLDQWAHNHSLVVLWSVMASSGIVSTVFIFLHYYLYKGIRERDFTKVDRWWKIMAVLTFLLFIFSAGTMRPIGVQSIEFTEVALFLFDLYSLWVIHAYRKDLCEGMDHTVEFERVL